MARKSSFPYRELSAALIGSATRKGGPAGRELRAPAKAKAFDKPKGKETSLPKEATAKLLYIGKETHYSIEACCDESQTE